MIHCCISAATDVWVAVLGQSNVCGSKALTLCYFSPKTIRYWHVALILCREIEKVNNVNSDLRKGPFSCAGHWVIQNGQSLLTWMLSTCTYFCHESLLSLSLIVFIMNLFYLLVNIQVFMCRSKQIPNAYTMPYLLRVFDVIRFLNKILFRKIYKSRYRYTKNAFFTSRKMILLTTSSHKPCNNVIHHYYVEVT